MENGFCSGARENTIRARTRVGDHEAEKRTQFDEAVSDCERAGHPFECGMVVAKGVDGGGPVEDMEVKVGEGGVVVELGFEEMEEV